MQCLVNFFIVLCILLVLFVAIKWVLSSANVAVPQPLVVIVGIIVIMIVVVYLLNCAGMGTSFHLWR